MNRNKLFVTLLILCTLTLVIAACGTDPVPAGITINFDTKGGNIIPSYTSGADAFAMPDEPVKEGFVFDGWFFDDDTFIESANAVKVLNKLHGDVTSVTVYAKWIAEEDLIVLADAKTNVLTALDHMYLSTTYQYTASSAADITRMTEIAGIFELDPEDDIIGNYEYLKNSIEMYKAYGLKVEDFVFISEYLEIYDGYEDISLISNEDSLRLSEIAALFGFTEGGIEYYYDELCSKLAFYEASYISPEDYTLYEEYISKAENQVNYLNYVEEHSSFTAKMASLVTYLGEDDIRAYKIQQIADYLNSYDYETFMLGEGEDIYSDGALVDDFILDLIATSEFTSDDLGLFFYRLFDFSIDEKNADINIDIDELEGYIDECELLISDFQASIAALNTGDVDYQNQLEMYNEFIDESESQIETYNTVIDNFEAQITTNNDLFTALTSAMITDFSEIIYNFTLIIHENNFSDLLFNVADSEQSPTIAELAVLISSFKATLEDFATAYGTVNWTTINTSIDTIIGVIAPDAETETFLGNALDGLLSENITAVMNKAAAVLGLLDAETLNIFLNEVTVDDVMQIKIADPSQFIFENLAILEAKIIAILAEEDYTESAAAVSYDSFTADIKSSVQDSLDLFYNEETMEDVKVPSEAIIGMPIILDFAFDLLKVKIIISDADFALIDTIAAIPYSVTDKPDVTVPMFDSLVVCDALYNLSLINEDIDEIVTHFGTVTEAQEKQIALLSAGLYMLDIDVAKIDAYKDYVIALDTTNMNDSYFIVKMVASMFEAEVGFTNSEITAIINMITPYVLDYVNAVMTAEEMDNQIILDAIAELSDSSYSEALSDLLVTLARSAMDVYLFSFNSIDGELLSFNDLAIKIDEALTAIKNVSYAGVEKETDLIALFEQAMIIGKEAALMQDNADVAQINIINNMIVSFFTAYGFDGTIDLLSDIVTELNEAGGPDIFKTAEGQEPGADMFIFIANVIVRLFADTEGDFDSVKFAGFITSAGTENDFSFVINTIMTDFEDINTIASTAYGSVTMEDLTFGPLVNGVFSDIFTTVSFDTDEGSTIEDLNLVKGSNFKEPEQPKKEGFIFDGWYLDQECITAYVFTTVPADDFTLYAKWTAIIE